MLIDLATRDGQTLITFKIDRPRSPAIELLIPTGENASRLDDVVDELTAIIDRTRYCDCSSDSCLECSIYQIITLIRRCLERAPRESRLPAALSVKYEDGTRSNLGTIDDGEGAAARLIESIAARKCPGAEGRVSARSAAGGRA